MTSSETQVCHCSLKLSICFWIVPMVRFTFQGPYQILVFSHKSCSVLRGTALLSHKSNFTVQCHAKKVQSLQLISLHVCMQLYHKVLFWILMFQNLWACNAMLTSKGMLFPMKTCIFSCPVSMCLVTSFSMSSSVCNVPPVLAARTVRCFPITKRLFGW